MTTSCTYLCLAAALGVTLSLALAPRILSEEVESEAKATPAEIIAEMGWLAGTWSGSMWGGQFIAYYSTPEGGKILSHSRLLKENVEAFYEFELFDTDEAGVRLAPFPGGRRAHGFVLTEHDSAARKVVFENPKKDFPTRIVYHRVADDNLVITLSDPHGASDKVETFDLKLAVTQAPAEEK